MSLFMFLQIAQNLKWFWANITRVENCCLFMLPFVSFKKRHVRKSFITYFTVVGLLSSVDSNQKVIKETIDVISIDPLFKDLHVRFTTVTFFLRLFDQNDEEFCFFTSCKLIIFNWGFLSRLLEDFSGSEKD